MRVDKTKDNGIYKVLHQIFLYCYWLEAIAIPLVDKPCG
ncbi:hypothetical protein A6A12_2215 [Vibrio anguillarum]|nr:hypothetical protein A6A12_2215 [Vibrio anguillarum]